jgi:hypothetical protein
MKLCTKKGAPPLPSQPLPLSQPQPTSLPLSQPQPTLSWHLVSESHSAEIDIPHDGACHQLGRRQLAAAALEANVPPFEFPS